MQFPSSSPRTRDKFVWNEFERLKAGPKGQSPWMDFVIQCRSLQRHWIPAFAGMTSM